MREHSFNFSPYTTGFSTVGTSIIRMEVMRVESDSLLLCRRRSSRSKETLMEYVREEHEGGRQEYDNCCDQQTIYSTQLRFSTTAAQAHKAVDVANAGQHPAEKQHQHHLGRSYQHGVVHRVADGQVAVKGHGRQQHEASSTKSGNKETWHRHKVRDTCTKPAPDSNRSDRITDNTKRYSNKNTKNKSELWPDSEEKPTSVRDEVTLNPADVMRRPQQTTRCDLRSTTTAKQS
ncbi:hypothetical protein F7725_010862 [Dissostichus mawsoni]|uniref:Uncharacterized protein n=1 Tax=Dissostichus mawsoni TaxID=36200 RepID=A0A7J5Z917_DISMA|nr:hypothetical protein F7725_010862 [Dissostichus mawsoni]